MEQRGVKKSFVWKKINNSRILYDRNVMIKDGVGIGGYIEESPYSTKQATSNCYFKPKKRKRNIVNMMFYNVVLNKKRKEDFSHQHQTKRLMKILYKNNNNTPVISPCIS